MINVEQCYQFEHKQYKTLTEESRNFKKLQLISNKRKTDDYTAILDFAEVV